MYSWHDADLWANYYRHSKRRTSIVKSWLTPCYQLLFTVKFSMEQTKLVNAREKMSKRCQVFLPRKWRICFQDKAGFRMLERHLTDHPEMIDFAGWVFACEKVKDVYLFIDRPIGAVLFRRWRKDQLRQVTLIYMTNFPTRSEKQIFGLGICPFGKSFSFVVVYFLYLTCTAG